MKPLPLAVFVIVVWTLLIILDNLPSPPPKTNRPVEPAVLTATNMPTQPSIRMMDQPHYGKRP